jgi:hypothetical protein
MVIVGSSRRRRPARRGHSVLVDARGLARGEARITPLVRADPRFGAMRTRAAAPRLALLTLLSLLVASCNNPVYTSATVESDLQREVHLTSAQADCLTQQLEAQILPDQLSSHTDPNDVEREQFRGIVQYAIVACSGSPYNAAVVAQGLVQHAGMTPATATCVAKNVGELVGAGNVASAQWVVALLHATAACASPSQYNRAAARAALSAIGYGDVGYTDFGPCLAALFEPRRVARSLAVLTAGVGHCLASQSKQSTTTTTAPRATTTSTG